MSRRLGTIAFVGLLAALVVGLPAAAAANGLRITEAGSSPSPGRAYVLSLPRGMQLPHGAVRVFENGRPVNGLSVTAVGEAKPQAFGVMLVVDSSMSMKGKPERAAFAAASAFAAQRRP